MKVNNYLSLIILLSFILTINILSIKHISITIDEPLHLNYGLQILKLNSTRPADSTMPFSFLNTIPYVLGKTFVPWNKNSFLFDIRTARYITILFSLLLAFYIYKWSKELYGPIAGIFSLLLYIMDPNIIAHSQLITTDLYASIMITIALYYFWKFLKYGGLKCLSLSALSFGIAQLAKYTCVLLYPIFMILILVKYSNKILASIKIKKITRLKHSLLLILIFIIINILVINAGFLFNKTFTAFGKYEFESNIFRSIQQDIKLLNYIPVPFPYPYLQGMDWFKANERTGKHCGNIYLLGKLHYKGEYFKGFKSYYLISYLFKVPIATQIFILLAIITYIFNYKKYNFITNELFLLIPVILFLIYFSFFTRSQIGIRHILIVFPLLYIFCGSFFKNWFSFNKKYKIFLVSLFVYLIISILSYFPHYLSYCNELILDRKMAYKIFADSNIDWRQGRWYLEQYLQNHPKTNLNPPGPVPGKVIVGVNDLVGVFDPYRFQWLRDNFKPVDHIAYSYLVFDVPKESVDALRKIYPVQNKPTDNITIQK